MSFGAVADPAASASMRQSFSCVDSSFGGRESISDWSFGNEGRRRRPTRSGDALSSRRVVVAAARSRSAGAWFAVRHARRRDNSSATPRFFAVGLSSSSS